MQRRDFTSRTWHCLLRHEVVRGEVIFLVDEEKRVEPLEQRMVEAHGQSSSTHGSSELADEIHMGAGDLCYQLAWKMT